MRVQLAVNTQRGDAMMVITSRTLCKAVFTSAFELFVAALVTTASAQEPPKFAVWNVDAVPNPSPIGQLLRAEGVQAELNLSDAQKKAHAAIVGRAQSRFQKMRNEIKD